MTPWYKHQDKENTEQHRHRIKEFAQAIELLLHQNKVDSALLEDSEPEKSWIMPLRVADSTMATFSKRHHFDDVLAGGQIRLKRGEFDQSYALLQKILMSGEDILADDAFSGGDILSIIKHDKEAAMKVYLEF